MLINPVPSSHLRVSHCQGSTSVQTPSGKETNCALLRGMPPQELLDVLPLVNFQERLFFLWEKKEVCALAHKFLLRFRSLLRGYRHRGQELSYASGLSPSQTPAIYWRQGQGPGSVYWALAFVKCQWSGLLWPFSLPTVLVTVFVKPFFPFEVWQLPVIVQYIVLRMKQPNSMFLLLMSESVSRSSYFAVFKEMNFGGMYMFSSL